MDTHQQFLAQRVLLTVLATWPLISLAALSDNKIHAVINTEKIALISSPMSGYVKKLHIKESAHFKKKDLLMEFDCRLQLAKQKISQAEVTLSDISLKSQHRLNKFGSASKLKVAQANATNQKALAEQEIANKQVSDCKIFAPFDGQVTELFINQHETIKENQQVFRILSNDSLIVRLLVPSSWLSQININTKFDVHIDETNKVYQAKITRISDDVDPISRSVNVIATVTNSDNELKSGMSGYAIFKMVQK